MKNSEKATCGDHGGTSKQRQAPCERVAGWGTDFDTGKCKQHRGTKPDGSTGENHGQGDQENNGNAETHGLTADAESWFERHRDECEDDVRRMVDSWMDDAPFGWDKYGNVRMLVSAAINECQVRQGDDYIRENGVITEEMRSAGEQLYKQDVSNPVFGYKSTLQNSTLRILNKLGIIDSAENKEADAKQELTDMWKSDLEG